MARRRKTKVTKADSFIADHSGEDAAGGLSAQFSIKSGEADERSQRDLLQDALIELGVGDKPAQALKLLRLDKDISEQEWERAITGECSLGPNLSHYLATLLYSDVPGMLRYDTSYGLSNYHKFVNRRVKESEDPALEITDERMAALRPVWLKDVTETSKLSTFIGEHSQKTPEWRTIERAAFAMLRKMMPHIRHKKGVELLTNTYRSIPVALTDDLVTMIGDKVDSIEVAKWTKAVLGAQPKYSGDGFRFLRLYGGFTIEEMSDRIGASITRISEYELKDFPESKLQSIVKAFNLSPQEASMLESGDLPGVDEAWLAAQKNASGKLVRVFREKRGMTQEEAGRQIGISQAMVGRWEMDGLPTSAPQRKIYRGLCTGLKLSQEESGWLRQAWLPDLDSARLGEQTSETRFDRLLRAHLLCADMEITELGSRLGIVRSALSHRIHDSDRILPQKYLEPFIGIIREASDALPESYRWFGDKEAGFLRETYHNSAQAIALKGEKGGAFNQDWLDQQPPAEKFGLLVHAHMRRAKTNFSDLDKWMEQSGYEVRNIRRYLNPSSPEFLRHEYLEPVITFLRGTNDQLPAASRWFDDEVADLLRATYETSAIARGRDKMGKVISTKIGGFASPGEEHHAELSKEKNPSLPDRPRPR